MKKLFVSVPMKNREPEKIKESIEKMHKIAEIVFGEELEVINPDMEGDSEVNVEVKNWSIYYLSEFVMAMANADYFIGISDCWEFREKCVIERRVAEEYCIPMFLVDSMHVAPDAHEIIRKVYEQMVPVCTG